MDERARVRRTNSTWRYGEKEKKKIQSDYVIIVVDAASVRPYNDIIVRRRREQTKKSKNQKKKSQSLPTQNDCYYVRRNSVPVTPGRRRRCRRTRNNDTL